MSNSHLSRATSVALEHNMEAVKKYKAALRKIGGFTPINPGETQCRWCGEDGGNQAEQHDMDCPTAIARDGTMTTDTPPSARAKRGKRA